VSTERSRHPMSRITLAVMLLATLLALPGLASGQEPPPLVGTLRLQQSPDDPDESFVFWKGGEVGAAIQHSIPVLGDQRISNCDNSPCFHYRLEVASPAAARLRVAIDTPARNDNFYTEVTPPGGTPVSVQNGNAFNGEIFIDEPPTGTYNVLVRPYSASNTRFQMRAKLEEVAFAFQPNPDGFLLPNLRPSAPYDLAFIAPANPAAGFAPDDLNPPLEAGPVHPLSCSWDETFHDQDVRCLRFGFGLVNAGEGNFDMRWTGAGFGVPDVPPSDHGPTFQCLQRADGPPVAREAGTFTFHPTHAHVHQDDIIYTELYKVTDPIEGKMWAAGEGRKLGYFPADQAFADWHRFVQAPRATSGSAGNCVEGSNQRIGMSVGWGDVYRWQRPGNYVDFGTNTDGLYVVRLTADPFDNILESNEKDNTGYTYVRVTGDQVEVLEYGRGLSPWDPNKQVLTPRIENGVPW
jgi:hypothetical protein